jgi:hypothetical protein
MLRVSGRVIDKNTHSPLMGASVVFSKYKGTITDKKGIFSLTLNNINGGKLKIAYVGYKPMDVPISKDNNIFISIEMEPNPQNLTEVFVSTKGKSIIERAIEKISINYSTAPIIIKGIMRVYNNINDTDYFYKSDAVAQVYAESYNNGKSQQVKIDQNKTSVLKNPQSVYYDIAPVAWVGGFASVTDIVYDRDLFMKSSSFNSYNFYERGKVMLSNRKTYVIDFEKKRNNKIEGTVFIDSITLAFVKIKVTKYNVKELFFETKSYAKQEVEYQMLGNKWYIKNSRDEAIYKTKFEGKEITEFVASNYDTLSAKKFAETETAQALDKHYEIRKIVPDSAWLKYDSLFIKAENENRLTEIDLPNIDTAAKRKKSIGATVFKYLAGNNFQIQTYISKYPFSVSNTGYGKVSEYGLGVSSNFRIYKNLFFQMGSEYCYGWGGLKTSLRSFGLGYQYLFNKQKRPFVITPYTGYSTISIKDTKANLIQHINNWIAGFTYSIELRHYKSLFLSAEYTDEISKHERILGIKPNSLSFKTGLLFKL